MDLITTAAPADYTPPAPSIVHNITASLVAGERPGVVHLVQYDQTLPIIAVRLIGNSNVPYAVPAGAAVNFRARKPDGKYIYNPALGLSADRSTAYIAVTPQTAAAAGKMRAVVEIVLDGTIAATANFEIDIAANPVPQDAIESTDEYKTIYDLLQETQAAADAAKESETAAAGSAADAEKSAEAAQASATAAAGSADTAGEHADAAQKSAQAAAGSADDAASSAAAAGDSATEAEDSATAAANSAAAAQAAADKVNLTNYYTMPQTDSLVDTAKTKIYTITVPADGWTNTAPYTNTVGVSGVTAQTLLSDITLAPADVGNNAALQAAQQWDMLDTQAGSVVFTASVQKPETDFTVIAREVR